MAVVANITNGTYELTVQKDIADHDFTILTMSDEADVLSVRFSTSELAEAMRVAGVV